MRSRLPTRWAQPPPPLRSSSTSRPTSWSYASCSPICGPRANTCSACAWCYRFFSSSPTICGRCSRPSPTRMLSTSYLHQTHPSLSFGSWPTASSSSSAALPTTSEMPSLCRCSALRIYHNHFALAHCRIKRNSSTLVKERLGSFSPDSLCASKIGVPERTQVGVVGHFQPLARTLTALPPQSPNRRHSACHRTRHIKC